MLGRIRRTTRTDVGLAIVFTGAAYLVWALVAGASRGLVQHTYPHGLQLHGLTRAVKIFFVDAGIVIDLVGIAWLATTLFLIVWSSRQKISISWSWASAMGQTAIAAIGAVIVAWAAYAPSLGAASSQPDTAMEKLSELSLWVILPIAVTTWVTFLTWLLVERARLNRHGPTLRDGLRSNR